MNRRTIMFIFICLVLTTLSTTVLAADYVGSAKCKTCHADQYNEWQKTAHGNMVQNAAEVLGSRTKPNYKYVIFNTYIIDKDYNWASEQWNPVTKSLEQGTRSGSWLGCAGCHTVGFNEATKTFVEAGVGCEACHGPAGDHLKTFSADDIVCNPGVEMCAPCHDGERQIGQMELMPEKFGRIGHLAIFDEAVKERGDGYQIRCAKCHSATVITAIQRGEIIPTMDDFWTGDLKNDRYGITCVACHDPHKVTEFEAQLKTDKQTTCTQCHTSTSDFQNPLPSGEKFTRAPHHPQTEFQSGRGVVGVPEVQSHGSALCVDCHMANGNHIFLPGTPTVTLLSHGREVVVDACVKCHSGLTTERVAAYQNKNEEALHALLTEYEALNKKAENNAKAKALLDQAWINIDFMEADKSLGIHNPRFFELVVEATQKLLVDAKAAL